MSDRERERERLINAILGTQIGSFMARERLESLEDDTVLERIHSRIRDIDISRKDTFYNDHY